MKTTILIASSLSIINVLLMYIIISYKVGESNRFGLLSISLLNIHFQMMSLKYSYFLNLLAAPPPPFENQMGDRNDKNYLS